MSGGFLVRVRPEEVRARRRDPIDAETRRVAAEVVEDVRARGEAAVREHAERFGEIAAGEPLLSDRAACEESLERIPAEDRTVLERAADRIRAFALAQRDCLRELDTPIAGGRAGHSLRPVDSAGCYVPGGRHPLPSTALMTVIPARVAEVPRVWVSSPRPGPITLAAAALAGAEGVLGVGGAHAIAAMAFGIVDLPPFDVIVGPGNRWVTAAKHHIYGHAGIDMLAGPSELVILADDRADPTWIAADLLAQAEHDPDAFPALVTTSHALIALVEASLARQLAELPSAETVRAALRNGMVVRCRDLEEAAEVCNELAPEHLELFVEDSTCLMPALRSYGALFIGPESAEVLGDYGAGPNHVLPTSSSARFTGGLSVMHFLKIQTWLRLQPCDETARLARDAAHLARLEGLEAHARAADRRYR